MTNAPGGAPLRNGVVRAALAIGVVLFCAAPTPGDVGSCGQRVQLLDPPAFFERKKATDCAKCRECDLKTDYCSAACDDDEEPKTEFPEGCEPIVHDGEACLNALDAAGCGDYEDFVRDEGRKSPNECRFCPWESP